MTVLHVVFSFDQNFFGSFMVFDDFSTVLRFPIGPNAPLFTAINDGRVLPSTELKLQSKCSKLQPFSSAW